MGQLSTHVLDTMHGNPANGMDLRLFRIEKGGANQLAKVTTNEEGRTEGPLLEGEAFIAGIYEIRFYVGNYFADMGVELPQPNFLGEVSIRFGIASPEEDFHVPFLVSPWSYSTYRGS